MENPDKITLKKLIDRSASANNELDEKIKNTEMHLNMLKKLFIKTHLTSEDMKIDAIEIIIELSQARGRLLEKKEIFSIVSGQMKEFLTENKDEDEA